MLILKKNILLCIFTEKRMMELFFTQKLITGMIDGFMVVIIGIIFILSLGLAEILFLFNNKPIAY
jgi:hypothetical protein